MHAILLLFTFDARQEGAEVDAKTTTGVTALWLAAGEGRKAVAADLIANGADVNNHRTDGITAVMAAAVGGHKVSYTAQCFLWDRQLVCEGVEKQRPRGPAHIRAVCLHFIYLAVACSWLSCSIVASFQLPL